MRESTFAELSNVRSLPSGRGGVALAYGAGSAASAANAVYYSADWTRQNISSRGPLGAFYRVWGDGKQMVKNDIFDYFGLSGYTVPQLRALGYIVWTPPRPQGEFIGEGDTFTFLNLVDNGLVGYEDGTPGGWAGHGVRVVAGDTARRTGQSAPSFSYEDFLRSVERAAAAGDVSPAARPPSPVPNFAPAAQNALAARMKWSVTRTYAGANHEPSLTIRGSSRISAHPGETVRLQGVASDPDGNAVAVRWWRWKDVDTCPGEVTLSNATSLATSIQVPADAVAGQTIQLVLEATMTERPTDPVPAGRRVGHTVSIG